MRLKRFNSMFISGIVLLLTMDAIAQPIPRVVKNKKDWKDFLYHLGAPKGYIDRQADSTLQVVEKILIKYPPLPEGPAGQVLSHPQSKESPERRPANSQYREDHSLQSVEALERRLALYAIDGVLFDDISSPMRPPVQAFFHSRMQHAAQAIRETRVSRGVRIFKLYDHGFIIKTRSVTVGFDLIRGYCVGAEGFPLGDREMEDILDQCDALFVSHDHADHVDEWVSLRCLSGGKPVVTPPDLWKNDPVHENLTVLERDLNRTHEVPVRNGKAVLKVAVLPGHQGKDVINNVYLVTTPEGNTVCHTGDQHYTEDFPWIKNVAKTRTVDVLLVNCWTRDIIDFISGFGPKLVVTGHEHELGHGTDHRKPYWLTYQRLAKCSVPYLVMTWGESFLFDP